MIASLLAALALALPFGSKVSATSGAANAPAMTSQDDAVERLREFIADQSRRAAEFPTPKRSWSEIVVTRLADFPRVRSGETYDNYATTYVYGVNRRALAVSALQAAKSFLDRGEIESAKLYANRATRHYIQSNNLFVLADQIYAGAAEDVGQAFADIYKAAATTAKLLATQACGTPCYEIIDTATLATDFAVDYGLEGVDEAQRKLVASVMAKLLLRGVGADRWIEERTATWMGDSGVRDELLRRLGSTEFERTFGQVLVETPGFAGKELAQFVTKNAVRSAREFLGAASFPAPAPDAASLTAPAPTPDNAPATVSQPVPQSPPAAGVPPVLPEFHGVYALDGGTLISLDGTPRAVSANAQFIVFDPKLRTLSVWGGTVEMRRLAFVRNRVVGNGAFPGDSRTYEKPEIIPLNKWMAVPTPDSKVVTKSKPLGASDEMIQIVPATPLAPGMYGFDDFVGYVGVDWSRVEAGLASGEFIAYDEHFHNAFAVGTFSADYRPTSFLDERLKGARPTATPENVAQSYDALIGKGHASVVDLDWAAARGHFEKALAARAGDANAAAQLREVAEDEAIALEAKKLPPLRGKEFDRVVAEATKSYEAKDYPTAIKKFKYLANQRRNYLAAYNIACCYALSGDKERACTWLEIAFHVGFTDRKAARADQDLASIRNEPRFRALIDGK